MDDAALNKSQLEASQSALLNILEDAESDKLRLGAAQRAILNILDDAHGDKVGLRATQTALLNILEDVNLEADQRRRTEQQVHQLNDSLEERVTQLLAANRELETFAYSVSHDLRAPLRAIDGFSKILLDDYQELLDDDGRDALHRVRRASQQMGELIDDMLKLSRSTTGTMETSPVDLGEIAKSVMASLREADPQRDVRALIVGAVVGLGDEHLLRAVLENLFSNAWKFTAKTPNALIEFFAEERGDELICSVRDNGAGFDMAFAHNLFLPFQRLHRATEYPGNGIGLATVERIISRLGGRVWAEGEVNRGATFHFTIARAHPRNEGQQQ